ADRGRAAIRVKPPVFEGFDGNEGCALGPGAEAGGVPLPEDAIARCESTRKIPANARVTEPYWHRKGEAGRYTFDADAPFGLPYRPTPFKVRMTLVFPIGGGSQWSQLSEDVIDELPVQHRYEGNIFSGEKRMDLLVAPALSVRVIPEIAIVPAASARAVKPGGPQGEAGERGVP